MSALLLTAVCVLAQPPGDRGADRDRGTATMSGRLEGTWTVVASERMGRPVTGARTATFRNGTLIFADAANSGTGGTGTGGTGTGSGAGGTGAGTGGRPAGGASDFSSLPSLRLDFGTTGTVRVSETGAGTGSTGGTGDRTGGNTGDRAGAPTGSGSGITRTGVFVLTQEYLAISVMDDLGGTGGGRTGGTGTGTGGTGTGGGSGAGAGGTGSGSGGTGGTGAGGRPAGAMDSTANQPYLTLILRRTGGAAGAGGDRR